MSAPIGYYVTCDDAVCTGCRPLEEWPGFEEWEAPLPIFYGTEADTLTHCGQCGDLVPHELTDEGYAYVRDQLGREGGSPEVRAQWVEVYGDGLAERDGS